MKLVILDKLVNLSAVIFLVCKMSITIILNHKVFMGLNKLTNKKCSDFQQMVLKLDIYM